MVEDIKGSVKEVYSETASAYDNVRFVRICADRILELANLRLGQSVLDVATGTGHLAIAAAQAVGPNGFVVGLDLTSEMLDVARSKANHLDLKNIEWREGDAEKLPFPNSGYDIVLCGSGIFFLPHQLVALKEWLRCLKPGGRVVFSTFGEGNNSNLAPILQRWLANYGLQGLGAPFPLPDPEQSQNLLEQAGFVDIQVLAERHDYFYKDIDEYWHEYLGTQSKAVSATLPSRDQDSFKKGLLEDVGTLAVVEGIPRVLSLNFAMGKKPDA